jgi:stage V sporulation protein R
LGLGRRKIFEVRAIHNDVTFIDTFLTPEFCARQKMFTYRHNEITGWYEIASREFQKIKEKLLFTLTNFGQPFIYIADGNYRNRGELYLRHRHEGIDLKIGYARDTLRNLYEIWQRPVNLETVVDGVGRLFTFDGREHTHREIRLLQLRLPELEKR